VYAYRLEQVKQKKAKTAKEDNKPHTNQLLVLASTAKASFASVFRHISS
jgi:hypothetical protein